MYKTILVVGAEIQSTAIDVSTAETQPLFLPMVPVQPFCNPLISPEFFPLISIPMVALPKNFMCAIRAAAAKEKNVNLNRF